MGKRAKRRAKARRRGHYDLAAVLKPYVMERDGRRCQYCGTGGAVTLDHVRPIALGGETDMGNLVACCERCNNFKNDLLPLEFFWFWGAAMRPWAKSPARGLRAYA